MQAHDSAHVVSCSPPPIHKHPHLAPRSEAARNSSCEDRDLFAWRKVIVVGMNGGCEEGKYRCQGGTIPCLCVTKKVVQNIDVTSTIVL